jgi:hypothetical protein
MTQFKVFHHMRGGSEEDQKKSHSAGLRARFELVTSRIQSRGSSIIIVFNYRLDDLSTGVLSPTETKEFSSSLCPDHI